GGNTVTTAEHTLAMIFALARKIPQATTSMKAGKWEKERFMGTELYNKNLGIVGMGQIGSHLAKLAHGAMMNVIAFDPYHAGDQEHHQCRHDRHDEGWREDHQLRPGRHHQ